MTGKWLPGTFSPSNKKGKGKTTNYNVVMAASKQARTKSDFRKFGQNCRPNLRRCRAPIIVKWHYIIKHAII